MADKAHASPHAYSALNITCEHEKGKSDPTLKSVESAPVAAVAGGQASCYQENEVHKPPDAKTSQGKQLSHRSPSVPETEPIDTKTPQEK